MAKKWPRIKFEATYPMKLNHPQKTLKLVICLFLFTLSQYAFSLQERAPIIDMHLHAIPYDVNGPQQASFCYPASKMIPYMDASQDGMDVFMEAMSNPPCDNPMLSAESDEALFQDIFTRLEKYNIVAVASGNNDISLNWYKRAPQRILPSVGFNLDYRNISTDSVKSLIQKHRFIGIGEVANQYGGIGVDDPRMDAYYALAQELDVPIGLHMGSGAPGSPMTVSPDYKVHLSHPLHLEMVIKKSTKLRVYIMH